MFFRQAFLALLGILVVKFEAQVTNRAQIK